MLNPQDENLMIDYAFGSLEKSEESAFSEKRNRDPRFERYYRRIQNALRPILEVRMDDSDQNQTLEKVKNLTARTMAFIHDAVAKNTHSRPESTAFTDVSAVNQPTECIYQAEAMNETVFSTARPVRCEEMEAQNERK